MKISLKSTGEVHGTTVQADGQDVSGVTAVRFSHGAGELPTLEIDLFSAEIEAQGRAEFYVADPADGSTKPVAKIVFADGSEWLAP